VILRLRLVSG